MYWADATETKRNARKGGREVLIRCIGGKTKPARGVRNRARHLARTKRKRGSASPVNSGCDEPWLPDRHPAASGELRAHLNVAPRRQEFHTCPPPMTPHEKAVAAINTRLAQTQANLRE